MRKRKRKIKHRNINRDISILTDVIFFKLERIEQKLDDKIQIEPEQAIIVNINSQRQGDQA